MIIQAVIHDFRIIDEIMSNFDPNAILRGAQLTVVGGSRPINSKAALKAEILSSIPRPTESRSLQV